MTHRQFVTWQVWQELDMNHPGKSEWYAMQVACEVRRVLMKAPQKVQPEDLKMKFKFIDPKAPKRKATPEEIKYESHRRIAAAMARMGPNVTIRYVNKKGEEVAPPNGR